jgi:hypothetical protein
LAVPGVIRNATSQEMVWRDTQAKEIINFCGNILQKGDTFYWYGWNKYSKTVQVYSSKTLASNSWKKEAVLINDGKFHGRPDVIYNPSTSNYVMIVKFSSPIGRDGIQYLTSPSPTGPFTTQLYEHKVLNGGEGVNMGDKGLYQDDDAAQTAYLLVTTDDGGNVNGTTKIVRLKPDYIGQEAVMQSWTVNTGRREAQAIVRRNGIYYLTSSATAGWNSSTTRYRTAASIEGQWSGLADVRTSPASADSFNTQHDFVLKITGTMGTSYMYAGDRWSEDTGVGYGWAGWYPMSFNAKGVPSINGIETWSIDTVTGLISTATNAPASTNVFHDTFEPDGSTDASRGDDFGAGFGPDIIWRTRANSGNQASAANFNIVLDPVMGNAMRYISTGNFYIVGQFDANASDEISTFPTNSTHSGGAFSTLGTNAGDRLLFSMDLRTTSTFSGGAGFRAGLFLDPDGPLAGAETSNNTWLNDGQGYFVSVANGSEATVGLSKETGDLTSSPLQGPDVTQLTYGTGAMAAMGADTEKHTLRFDITRVAASSVRIDAYWDGQLVSSATDTASALDRFNSVVVQVASGATYLFDNAVLYAAGPEEIAPPSLSVSQADGALLLSAAGGPPGTPVYLLASTSLEQQPSNWPRASTNWFDESGAAAFTNVIEPGGQKLFFLSVP